MTFLETTPGASDKFKEQMTRAELEISPNGNVKITCLAGRMEGIFGLRASQEYVKKNAAKFNTLPNKEKAE